MKQFETMYADYTAENGPLEISYEHPEETRRSYISTEAVASATTPEKPARAKFLSLGWSWGRFGKAFGVAAVLVAVGVTFDIPAALHREATLSDALSSIAASIDSSENLQARAIDGVPSDVQWIASGTPGSYCIKASMKDGGALLGGQRVLAYDSTGGGVSKKTVGACSSKTIRDSGLALAPVEKFTALDNTDIQK